MSVILGTITMRLGFGYRTTTALILTMTLVLSGCNKPKLDERAPEPGDVAVARIHDQTVWASDVRNEAVQQGLIGEGEPLDIANPLFRRTLEEVIDQKLLARAAMAKGLDKTDLAQRRISASKEDILGHMLLESTVDGAIDEKKVKALYDEQVVLAKKSEEIRASLILLKTREEAINVFKQIQGGAVFEAMAMERSIDQATRYNGGDMNYFTTDLIPDSYKAALMGAQVGQTVGPVQIDGGWAVFKLTERRPEQPMTLEQARPRIISALKLEEVRGLLQSLRSGTRVEMLMKEADFGPGAGREPDSAATPVEPTLDASPNTSPNTSPVSASSEVATKASGNSASVSPAAKPVSPKINTATPPKTP
jgi:peptidyl-prolyl cis-trans isomerase C